MRTKAVPTCAKLEQVALDAARAASRIHLQRLSRIKVTGKTNAIDLVTEADRESEQAVIRTLSRAFPDHSILAEESGANAQIRPTAPPISGFPSSACRLATSGRLELAVVYDALKRELFLNAVLSNLLGSCGRVEVGRNGAVLYRAPKGLAFNGGAPPGPTSRCTKKAEWP